MMEMNTMKVNISLEVEAVITNTTGDHKYLVATPYGTVHTDENGVRQLVWDPTHPGRHDYMIIYADNPAQARDKYKELNTESEWCSVIEELPYQRYRLTISLRDMYDEFNHCNVLLDDVVPELEKVTGELSHMLQGGFRGTLSYGIMSPDTETLVGLMDLIATSYFRGRTQHDNGDDRGMKWDWDPTARKKKNRKGVILLITSNKEKYKEKPEFYTCDISSPLEGLHAILGKRIEVIQMDSINILEIERLANTLIEVNHIDIDGVIFDYTFKDEEYNKVHEIRGLMRECNIPIIIFKKLSRVAPSAIVFPTRLSSVTPPDNNDSYISGKLVYWLDEVILATDGDYGDYKLLKHKEIPNQY